MGKEKSYFDGSLLGLFGIELVSFFVTFITIGILYPFMLCWKEKWVCKHTYIEGKRLVFDGNGAQLIGKWILWLFLTLITAFIFLLWLPIKTKKWTVKHTHFR